MFPEEFNELVEILKTIPGITKKQAIKIVNFFCQKDTKEQEKIIQNFLCKLKKIKNCKICDFYTIENDICSICNSNDRENKLLIVENLYQIQKYEEGKIFNGKYFKLPQLFSKNFVKNNHNFDENFFLNYIKEFNEVVIGLSPTPEGILSTNYLLDLIKKSSIKINITKLAIGVPLGSSIDYMDNLTISYAFSNRKETK